MNDLIYRQSAINAIENTDCELLAEEWDELTNAIKQVPSAEPKRGKWLKKPDPYDGFFGKIPVCSQCGCTPKWREECKYCPNCGAKMEVSE